MAVEFCMRILSIYLKYMPIKYLDYTHGKHFIEKKKSIVTQGWFE